MVTLRPIRLAVCFALLAVMAWPLAAQAGAKTAPSTQAAPVNLVGVDMVSPSGVVKIAGINSQATVTGTSFADNLVVSYVTFWVDLPQSQIINPQPYGGCPSGPTTCQYMGQDDQPLYSLGYRYDGPSGPHTATAQVWRSVWGDAQPVLLGQDSSEFCLNNCGS